MAITYEPIATSTLGSAQSSVTFSSISATYTDLVAIVTGGASAQCQAVLSTNNSSSAASVARVTGDGSTLVWNYTSGASDFTWTAGNQVQTSNTFVAKIQIQQYSNTNIFKQILFQSGVGSFSTVFSGGLLRATTAVNSVTFSLSGGATWNTGSTFTLYGIKAA